VSPSIGESYDDMKNSFQPGGRTGNTLYVGPGQTYTQIQAAIDSASMGDTIRVSAGIYNENVIVDKTVTIIGSGASSTTIDGGGNDDAVFISADWVNLTDFKITNCGNIQYNDAGIELNNVSNCIIENNHLFSNNQYGILLNHSANNTVTNNNASSNTNDGIHLLSSTGNTILNNNAHSNNVGIYVNNFGGNTIINNIVTKNRWSGIILDSSFSNTLDNNTCNTNYNGKGIYLDNSNNEILLSNTLINDGILVEGPLRKHWNTHQIETTNTVNGKPVYYWSDQTEGTVPPGAGQIILANCENVTVKDQIISGGVIGISLAFSSKNKIINNTATLSYHNCISLFESYDNSITNNVISSNTIGINLNFASDNKIEGNMISDSIDGIFICCVSFSNTISNNIIDSNDNGIRITSSWANTIESNTCSDNGIGISITSMVSKDNTIESNTCSDNGIGISITSSDSNSIKNNNVSSNKEYGIHISESYDTTISNNIISSNDNYGLALNSATNSIIYNNYFIDNTIQAYDDGTNQWNLSKPDGGNYWSDLIWSDNDKDGYIDEPYEIDGSRSARDFLPSVHLPGVSLTINTQNFLTAYVEQLYSINYIAFDPTPNTEFNWTLKTNALWLDLSQSQELYGTPEISDFGSYWVYISVSNGYETDFTNFTLNVLIKSPSNDTPPVTVSTTPIHTETYVSINITQLKIEFSKPMNTASVKNALSISPHVNHILSWDHDDTEMTILLTEDLTYDTIYTITIDTNAEDIFGIRFTVPLVLEFTAEPESLIDDGGSIDTESRIFFGLLIFLVIMIMITLVVVTKKVGRRKGEEISEPQIELRGEKEIVRTNIAHEFPFPQDFPSGTDEYILALAQEALVLRKPSDFDQSEEMLMEKVRKKYQNGEISKATFESIKDEFTRHEQNRMTG